MDKPDFIKVFELTLVCANLAVTALSLTDDNTVQITFQGGGTRRVDIEADSYGAIIVDVMKCVF